MMIFPMIRKKTAPVGGGNDSNTVVLLHFDGSDASTTITNDASGGSTTFTANGDAQLDTADQQFGSASLLLDGSGDSVSFDGSTSDFTWASDFTIDFWLNSTSQAIEGGAVRRVLGMGAGTTNLEIYINSSTGAIEFANSSGTLLASTTDISDSTWHHIEFSRASGTLRVFVDGTSEASTSNSTTWAGSSTSYIGRYQGSAIGHYVGWIDELRISKDVARHTSNFTPPTAAYS